MESDKPISAVREVTVMDVIEEQQMEIVISDSGVNDPSDNNVPGQQKCDDSVEDKKVPSDDNDNPGAEAGEGEEKGIEEGEGLELSIADVSSVSLSNYSVGEKTGDDDVNKSIVIKSETLPPAMVEVGTKKQEKVKCPYCDFEFEEFSSDTFAEHLRTVHFITKSLDILLEFSLSTINKGNKLFRDLCVCMCYETLRCHDISGYH